MVTKVKHGQDDLETIAETVGIINDLDNKINGLMCDRQRMANNVARMVSNNKDLAYDVLKQVPIKTLQAIMYRTLTKR